MIQLFKKTEKNLPYSCNILPIFAQQKTGLTLPQSAILAQYRALSAELQVFDHDKYI